MEHPSEAVFQIPDGELLEGMLPKEIIGDVPRLERARRFRKIQDAH
jgi:hypothetical protein